MKKLLLPVAGMLLAIASFGQGAATMSLSTNGRQENGFTGAGYNETADQRLERLASGAMYLRDVEGDAIVFKGNAEQEFTRGKVNVFANQIEWLDEEGGTIYYTPYIADGFTIKYPDEPYARTFEVVVAPTFKKKRFMEVLSDGEVKFFRHYVVVKSLPGANAAYNTSSSLDEFQLKEEYYIQFEGEELQQFYPSKGQLKKIFRDRSDAVLQFMKSNRLRYSKVENVAKVFDFYNDSVDD